MESGRVILGILVSACLFISCGKKEEGATKQSTADTTSLAEAPKNLEKLGGRWQRLTVAQSESLARIRSFCLPLPVM